VFFITPDNNTTHDNIEQTNKLADWAILELDKIKNKSLKHFELRLNGMNFLISSY
jgi:hypothetical protein